MSAKADRSGNAEKGSATRAHSPTRERRRTSRRRDGRAGPDQGAAGRGRRVLRRRPGHRAGPRRGSTSPWPGTATRPSGCSTTDDPDLVLLDLMLPRLSGIDVCRSIRARSSVPIIMVTAKGTEIDTVVGLEVGADDYVAKPYRLRELVARMRAVLRRTPGRPRRPHRAAPTPVGTGLGRSTGAATDRRPGSRASSRRAASRSTPTATWSSSAARTSTSGARSSSCSPC